MLGSLWGLETNFSKHFDSLCVVVVVVAQRYLKNKEGAEAAEWDQCFELLEAMLKINADERITAADILAHPFIDSTEVDCRLDRRIPSPTDPHPPGTAGVQSTTREQVEEEEEEEPEG